MAAVVVLVHHRVPPAAGYEPAVDRERGHERHRQGESEAPPEKEARKPRLHRTGDDEYDQVVHDLHDRDRERVGRKGDGKYRR